MKLKSQGVSLEDDDRLMRITWAMLGCIVLSVIVAGIISTIATRGDDERFFKQEIRAVIKSKYVPPSDPNDYRIYLADPVYPNTLYVNLQHYNQAQAGDSVIKPRYSYTYYLSSDSSRLSIALDEAYSK